jgi:hypothetical protein
MLNLMQFYKAPAKRKPANYWNISGTGDYGLDCATGVGLARSYLVTVRNVNTPILSHIIMDMVTNYGGVIPESDKGLIVGMMAEIERMMAEIERMMAEIERMMTHNDLLIRALASHGLTYTIKQEGQ